MCIRAYKDYIEFLHAPTVKIAVKQELVLFFLSFEFHRE